MSHQALHTAGLFCAQHGPGVCSRLLGAWQATAQALTTASGLLLLLTALSKLEREIHQPAEPGVERAARGTIQPRSWKGEAYSQGEIGVA